jgi:hypothetical protein
MKYSIEDQNSDEIIAYILLSIGKYSGERKKKIKLTCEEMMEYAVNYIENGDKSITDIDDRAALLHLVFSLTEFLKGSRLKRVINKDATASGYMLQTYLMGIDITKQETLLKYINLMDDTAFYDTYQAITSLVLENCDIPTHLYEIISKRHVMKAPYMIIPYSAGNNKC